MFLKFKLLVEFVLCVAVHIQFHCNRVIFSLCGLTELQGHLFPESAGVPKETIPIGIYTGIPNLDPFDQIF